MDESVAFEKSLADTRNSLIPFQQTDARWNSIPYGLYAKAGTSSAHTAYIGLDYKRGYGQSGYPGCTAHANCTYLNKENSHYYGSGCGILSTFNALYAMDNGLRSLTD